LRTILYFISFIIKTLLLLILSPLIIIIFVFRYCLYRAVFRRHLIKNGMPKKEAGYLLKNLKIMDLMDFVKKKA
jgi:hypothetical protein